MPVTGFSRRTFLKRAGLATAGLAVIPYLGVACDDDDESGSLLERAQEQGFIRVGFANEAPYGYADASGNLTGEAPDVAREVFGRLGIDQVDGVLTPFGSLIPGLQAGRFDVIAAGMFINPERCQQILFSDPDYCIPQAFGVEAGNPLRLTSYEDVAANSDVRLGVIGGGVESGYAEALGVSGNQIVVFDDPSSLPEALQAGRIDAFAATSLSVREQVERVGGGLESTPGFTPVIDGEPQAGCGGYGFRNDDEELRDAFNEILVTMKRNNEIVPITEPHGFGPDEIGAALERTAAELCEE